LLLLCDADSASIVWRWLLLLELLQAQHNIG
jgi:hypothetical protein